MPGYEKTRHNTMKFIRNKLRDGIPISMNELVWQTIEKYGVSERFCERYIGRLIETGKVNGRDEENLVWVGEEEEQEDLTDTSEDGIMEEHLQ